MVFDRMVAGRQGAGPQGTGHVGAVRCVANLSFDPVELPAHTAVILTSGPLASDGLLPPDTSAWLRVRSE